MGLDVQKYWAYRDEYGIKLKRCDCLEKIHNLFCLYKKDILIRLISAIAIDLGLDTNVEIYKKVQSKIFGFSINKNLIHRSALNIFYEFILDFNDFSNTDTRENVKPLHIAEIFLLLNEFFNVIYDETESLNDYSTTQKIIFYGIKQFYGIYNTEDIRAKSFYFTRLYDEIYNNTEYKNEITFFEKEFKISFVEYKKLLKSLSEYRDTRIIYNIYLEKFSLDFDKIKKMWDERKPKIQSPFDFKFLLDFPVIKHFEDMFVLSAYYLFFALIMKCYYLLCNKTDTPKFREKVTKDIFPKIIKNFLVDIFTNEEIKEINLEYNNNKEYGDWGMVYRNYIFLFEIKSGTIPVEKKYGNDIKVFFDELSKKYVNEQGMIQQIKSLMEIDNNYSQFCSRCAIEMKKYTILPFIIIYDDIFEQTGVNIYMKQEFEKLIAKKNFKSQNFIFDNNSGILTFTDLFVFSTKKYENKVDRLMTLIKYYNDSRLPFREHIY